ncbi:hypothetical protein BDN71DRAFT_1511858 [Pleurotus eryngii]|uniref:Helitron helicase-like domain-containing protein n=1 Tax=Pleurotus eryngii TaxID=5323 RepID=A0A9P5ZLK4_PLEER|nr:hypothetical protein BDN71DRAFT_1511858 [Pleurotus eryngii]
MSQHVDFTVRCQKVLEALQYKIANDPGYADLEIDNDALLSLPENGPIAHHIPTCWEGCQDPDSIVRVGLDTTADVLQEDEGDTCEDVGVGGVLNINAPVMNPEPINEATAGYMTLAFPTLFSNGEGNFYEPRLCKIDLGEYFSHLLHFRGGCTIERAARQESSSDSSTMLCYGAKLWGTQAFWLAQHWELMGKIQVLGSLSVFFTLSAADLQWPDLHKHMPEEIPVPAGDDQAGRRQHRLALNNNPHIAAAYLDKRLQLFMKNFLIPFLGVAHFWY